MNPETFRKLDEFTRAYFECALWSSTDPNTNGEPLDDVYEVQDISEDSAGKMIRDCEDFQEKAGALISGQESRAGHDFWLTRNRHGAGFWDGDWPEADGEKLTEMSHGFGECTLLPDGKVLELFPG